MDCETNVKAKLQFSMPMSEYSPALSIPYCWLTTAWLCRCQQTNDLQHACQWKTPIKIAVLTVFDQQKRCCGKDSCNHPSMTESQKLAELGSHALPAPGQPSELSGPASSTSGFQTDPHPKPSPGDGSFDRPKSPIAPAPLSASHTYEPYTIYTGDYLQLLWCDFQRIKVCCVSDIDFVP